MKPKTLITVLTFTLAACGDSSGPGRPAPSPDDTDSSECSRNSDCGFEYICDRGQCVRNQTQNPPRDPPSRVDLTPSQIVFAGCGASERNTNYCSGQYANVLKVAPEGSFDGQKIGYIEYDLSSVQARAGQLKSALLVFKDLGGSTNNSDTFDEVSLIRIAFSWNACQTTCNNLPNLELQPHANITLAGTTFTLNFDATFLIQSWLQDPSRNHGIALRAIPGSNPRAQYKTLGPPVLHLNF